MSNIGIRIKAKREELKWTQEELAFKMGYKSKSTINKIELGINDIVQSKVVQFAEVLGTSVAYLMGWEQEETDSALAKPTEAFAMSIEDTFQHKWMEEVGTTDFSEEELKQIFDFANYIISKRK